MIESKYWKEDILKHSRKLKPCKKPKKWTNKLQVNFEKEIIITFFMIRKLFETNKLSNKSKDYKASIYRVPIKDINVNNLNYFDLDLYNYNNEEKCSKSILFICNQFIHGGATYTFRDKKRNWDYIYVCSDFERNKYIYKISIDKIKKIFKIVGKDYPSQINYTYSKEKKDYIVTTN
jgi:hypothetical protein